MMTTLLLLLNIVLSLAILISHARKTDTLQLLRHEWSVVMAWATKEFPSLKKHLGENGESS